MCSCTFCLRGSGSGERKCTWSWSHSWQRKPSGEGSCLCAEKHLDMLGERRAGRTWKVTGAPSSELAELFHLRRGGRGWREGDREAGGGRRPAQWRGPKSRRCQQRRKRDSDTSSFLLRTQILLLVGGLPGARGKEGPGLHPSTRACRAGPTLSSGLGKAGMLDAAAI